MKTIWYDIVEHDRKAYRSECPFIDGGYVGEGVYKNGCMQTNKRYRAQDTNSCVYCKGVNTKEGYVFCDYNEE